MKKNAPECQKAPKTQQFLNLFFTSEVWSVRLSSNFATSSCIAWFHVWRSSQTGSKHGVWSRYRSVRMFLDYRTMETKWSFYVFPRKQDKLLPGWDFSPADEKRKQFWEKGTDSNSSWTLLSAYTTYGHTFSHSDRVILFTLLKTKYFNLTFIIFSFSFHVYNAVWQFKAHAKVKHATL